MVNRGNQNFVTNPVYNGRLGIEAFESKTTKEMSIDDFSFEITEELSASFEKRFRETIDSELAKNGR